MNGLPGAVQSRDPASAAAEVKSPLAHQNKRPSRQGRPFCALRQRIEGTAPIAVNLLT